MCNRSDEDHKQRQEDADEKLTNELQKEITRLENSKRELTKLTVQRAKSVLESGDLRGMRQLWAELIGLSK